MALSVLRALWRAPGHALPVFVLAAIAVAVNATALSAIDALAWRALPFREPDRLVELRMDLQDIGLQVALSHTLFDLVRAEPAVFADAAGAIAARPVSDDAGQTWSLQRVTPDFLKALGAAPVLGRDFAESDLAGAANPVVIVSERVWRARLGADSAALGRTIRLNDSTYTVIGVMPRAFAYPDATADAWMPYLPSSSEQEQDAAGAFGQFTVTARLADSVDIAMARERFAAILATTDVLARMRSAGARFSGDVRPWRARFTDGHLRALTLLQLAGGLLLAVVAANLANLVLARLVARRREIAIRRALGASRRALLRAVLVDVLPPVVAGVVVGLALAPIGIAVLRALSLLPETLVIDGGIGLAAIVAAAVTAVVVVGVVLIVAVAALRRDAALTSGLRERALAGGSARLRATMLIAQVTLTTVLVGAAGLLWRSAANLVQEDPGFTPAGVLMTAVDVSGEGVVAPSSAAMRDRIAALPGVATVAVADSVPFGASHFIGKVHGPGDGADVVVRSHGVGLGYFDALGMTRLRGRDFSRDGAGEVIVDELFQRQWFGTADALGATIRIASDADDGTYRDARVVGVVPSVKHRALDETADQAAMYALVPSPGGVFYFITRTAGDPAQLVEPVRRLMREIAPDAVLSFNRPLSDAVATTLAGRLALLKLIAFFAIVTLLLAAIGLYAQLSLAVRARTGEIGVRMALGANPLRILRMVLAQGGGFVVPGVLLGLAVGIPLARGMGDQFYRVGAADPFTWLVTGTAILLAALVACLAPAWRATRVEPRTALDAA